jgi:hypothetical protein
MTKNKPHNPMQKKEFLKNHHYINSISDWGLISKANWAILIDGSKFFLFFHVDHLSKYPVT